MCLPEFGEISTNLMVFWTNFRDFDFFWRKPRRYRQPREPHRSRLFSKNGFRKNVLLITFLNFWIFIFWNFAGNLRRQDDIRHIRVTNARGSQRRSTNRLRDVIEIHRRGERPHQPAFIQKTNFFFQNKLLIFFPMIFVFSHFHGNLPVPLPKSESMSAGRRPAQSASLPNNGRHKREEALNAAKRKPICVSFAPNVLA